MQKNYLRCNQFRASQCYSLSDVLNLNHYYLALVCAQSYTSAEKPRVAQLGDKDHRHTDQRIYVYVLNDFTVKYFSSPFELKGIFTYC